MTHCVNGVRRPAALRGKQPQTQRSGNPTTGLRRACARSCTSCRSSQLGTARRESVWYHFGTAWHLFVSMLHFVLRSLQPVVVLMCVSSVLCYDLLVLLPCVASRHRQHRHRQPLILWCLLSNSRYMSGMRVFGHIHTHIYIYIYIIVAVDVYLYVYISIYIYMRIYMYVYIYICICVCVCVCYRSIISP